MKILNRIKSLLGLPVRLTPEELFETLCGLDDIQLELLRMHHIRTIKSLLAIVPEDSKDNKDLLELLAFMEFGGPRVCTIAQFTEHRICNRWGVRLASQ